MPPNFYVIAITGGSGSGKTTFANRVREQLGPEELLVLNQDSYYIDQSHKFDRDGGAVNFDHPSALDLDLMAKHIRQYKEGSPIEVPEYDFATHSRSNETKQIKPTGHLIVDGTLILSHEGLRELVDLAIFLKVPEQTRFSRRLERDVKLRGRTPDGVKAQFAKQVKPMHDEHVEPQQEHAHHIAECEKTFEEALRKVVELLSKK